MKVIKRILVLIISIVTILTLISCGVNNNANQQMMLRTETTAMYGGMGFARANAKLAAVEEIEVENRALDGVHYVSNISENTNSDRKIVKNVDLNTETKTFTESIEWLKAYVERYKGIIDSLYIDSGNTNNKNYRKNANFNIRIPAEKLDAFLNKIGDNLNIVFRQENISDITEEYSDVASRLESLKIEESSLNDMLKKAKTVEEMIKVEDKLSSVRTDIENITRRLNRYDKQVSYSTVNISVSEVKDLTEPKSLEDDFSKEVLLRELKKNIEEAKRFVLRLGVNIFTHIPWIILGLVAILLLVIIFAIFRACFENTRKADDIKYISPKVTTADNKDDEVEVEFYQEEKK